MAPNLDRHFHFSECAKNECAGPSLSRFYGVTHVENVEIVALDKDEVLAELLVADLAAGSLPEKADHSGDAHVW